MILHGKDAETDPKGGAARRRPVVGVMGSGSSEWRALSEPLGRRLAELGVHLLTGGGAGTMAATSRTFSAVQDRKGLVLGVLPSREDLPGVPPEGYPNPWVEVVLQTHLAARGSDGAAPHSRNHINVLSADVVLALPGGEGTSSEVLLALEYGRPVIAHLKDRSQIPRLPEKVEVAHTLEGVEAFLRRHLEFLP